MPRKTQQFPDVRLDAWINSAANFGFGLDKASQTCILPICRLTDRQLSNLYYSEPISHRIVDIPPQEMFRRGYCLKSESNQDAADAAEDAGDLIDIKGNFREAAIWGRLWGGNLTILGANDGLGDLASPLNDQAAIGLQFLLNIDRRWANVVKRYDTPGDPRFGKPELYQINNLDGRIFYVHESRTVRFEGIPVDILKDRELQGWTYSVLQLSYDALVKLATAYDATSNLMTDASQGVFKLKGLWKQISSGSKEALQTLMRVVDMTRSTSRSILLDVDEDFNRIATSFQGIPEMLDRYAILVSAATGIPVTLLMGRSPAGMNATGESDIRLFYDWIAAEQERVMTPKLLRVYRMLYPGLPEDTCIEWCPLYEPTDLEKAQTDLAEAQAEKAEADTYMVYVTMGALMPAEVAIAEFGSGEGEIEIDEAFLQKSLKADKELALNPPEPVDPNADPNAPKPANPAR